MDRRKIAAIFGTIVLGALGSGLWELLKPMGTSAWDATLTVATLGLESVKDGLYLSAARLGATGARSHAGIQLLVTLILLTTFGVLMSLRSLLPKLGISGHSSYALPLFFFGSAVAMMISATRTTYVVKVAIYYEQLAVIAAPYLDTQARLELASRAVRARDRNDYLAVISELESVIDARGINFSKQDLY